MVYNWVWPIDINGQLRRNERENRRLIRSARVLDVKRRKQEDAVRENLVRDPLLAASQADILACETGKRMVMSNAIKTNVEVSTQLEMVKQSVSLNETVKDNNNLLARIHHTTDPKKISSNLKKFRRHAELEQHITDETKSVFTELAESHTEQSETSEDILQRICIEEGINPPTKVPGGNSSSSSSSMTEDQAVALALGKRIDEL